MSRYLLDTNILTGLSAPADPMRPAAIAALAKLLTTGDELCICSQSLIEFRSVATRPIAGNGLGLTSVAATNEVARYLSVFQFLPESPAIFTVWRTLAETTGTLGKQNHDARMMASAMVGTCQHLLTFNGKDFVRYAALSSVSPIDPAQI